MPTSAPLAVVCVAVGLPPIALPAAAAAADASTGKIDLRCQQPLQFDWPAEPLSEAAWSSSLNTEILVASSASAFRRGKVVGTRGLRF